MKKFNFVAEAELVLKIGDLKILTEHRIELLRQIGLTKNLTKSAKLAGYSYKGAWDVIDSITRETGDAVVARVTGGKGGGHTVITPFGVALIRNFDLVKQDHQRFVSRLNMLANGFDEDYAHSVDTPMRTSARNQLAGIIKAISQEKATDEILIKLPNSSELLVSVTHDSSRVLNLEIGAKVFALIKASAITITDDENKKSSDGKNKFLGTLIKINQGTERTEFTISVDEKFQLVGTASNADWFLAQAAIGKSVEVSIDATKIILAVPA